MTLVGDFAIGGDWIVSPMVYLSCEQDTFIKRVCVSLVLQHAKGKTVPESNCYHVTLSGDVWREMQKAIDIAIIELEKESQS